MPSADDGADLPAFAIPRPLVCLAAVAVAITLLALTARLPWRTLEPPVRPADLLVALGKMAALLAAMLLMLQFTLSARLKILDRAFALDRLLRLHAGAGAAAGVLAISHPLLLYATDVYEFGALGTDRWRELLGVAAVVLLSVVVLTSLWRVFLRIPYGAWRIIHLLTFCIVAVVSIHALSLGGDLAGGWPRYFWIAVISLYGALFVWTKIVKPVRLRLHRYVVEEVRQVSHNTWNLELAPVDGERFSYYPGQFAFLRPYHKGLRTEEHPFTISSSPSRKDRIAFTIKESGDFTSKIGRVERGDLAAVDGPYGRFSFLLRNEAPLLMIAGGVGITPVMSMLRYMADTRDRRPVTLVWGNRTENDIFFREELESLRESLLQFTIHHVLSHEPRWEGPTGLLSEPLLSELLAAEDRRSQVFLCGPPPMMASVSAALRALGFPRRRIHTERFAL